MQDEILKLPKSLNLMSSGGIWDALYRFLWQNIDFFTSKIQIPIKRIMAGLVLDTPL